MSEDMYLEGYQNIVDLDFSEIVAEDMQLKYQNAGYDSLKCTPDEDVDVFGDVKNMGHLFENETFNCVIDKGTLDSVLVHIDLTSAEAIPNRMSEKCSKK